MSERSEALRHAVSTDPDNHALRFMLADALLADEALEDAVREYRLVFEHDAVPRDRLAEVADAAVRAGDAAFADRLLQRARELGVVEGVAEVEQRRHKIGPSEDWLSDLVAPGSDQADPAAERSTIVFTDVGGLESVKKAIHRTIILPFQRPDLYEKYGRSAGGGVMLFGPPGCGKTMLARATAGECQLPFINVRIEDVVDPYFGVSERNLHEMFERARTATPCVLFIDELDGLAYARRKREGTGGRVLVDQMLQELDSIGSNNQDLLVLGATNAPWDVDDALKRPGRFDRVVFVPPPDSEARSAILTGLLESKPQQGIDIEQLVSETPLFSGADLAHLVESAVDRVIDEALDSNPDATLGMNHFADAIKTIRPTTLDWLARARNYVEFANRDERYRDVAEFLQSPDVRKQQF